MEAYIKKLRDSTRERRKESHSSSSSLSSFDPVDRPFLISEYVADVSHTKRADLDIQDVIVTIFPCMTKTSVVSFILTLVSSAKVSVLFPEVRCRCIRPQQKML